MSTPIPIEPEDSTDPVVTETPAPVPAPESAHPDPITGEPGAHPVGVGVGALGAGAAGAAIGAIGGPIGMLIGAAIGAVAGGLAGKEVAATNDTPVAEETAAMADEPVGTEGAGMSAVTDALPGENFRASGGSEFAGDAGLLSTGSSSLTGTSPEDGGTAALPTLTPAAASSGMGFETPAVPETTPLAETPTPRHGEEAVRVSAYHHFLHRSRAGESGDEMGDWLAAERGTKLG